MPQSDIAAWLKFALQQMAAESYLDNIDLNIPEEGEEKRGHSRFPGSLTN